MKVKFTKDWSGPYGIFVKGRVVELSGPMLAAAPKDSYVEAGPEEAKGTESNGKKTAEPKSKAEPKGKAEPEGNTSPKTKRIPDTKPDTVGHSR